MTKPKVDDQTIFLDGKSLYDTEFNRCIFVFSGMIPFTMVGCDMNQCNWSFTGPAAATLEFLGVLYKMGGAGRELVENTFQNIREGAPLNEIDRDMDEIPE